MQIQFQFNSQKLALAQSYYLPGWAGLCNNIGPLGYLYLDHGAINSL